MKSLYYFLIFSRLYGEDPFSSNICPIWTPEVTQVLNRNDVGTVVHRLGGQPVFLFHDFLVLIPCLFS